VALVTPVLGLCRSCRGRPTFGEIAVGRSLSSSPGSGHPLWNRQPAASATGSPGGAGLPVFESWRLLGRQPAHCLARGAPPKSSPRQSSSAADPPPPPPAGVTTRARAGLHRPSKRYPADVYACVASTPMLSPVPTSIGAALRDPQWRAAMQEEFEALQRNQTWKLIPCPPHANITTDKWVFKRRLPSDGTLECYKERLVV
jgi:hypothetical protein